MLSSSIVMLRWTAFLSGLRSTLKLYRCINRNPGMVPYMEPLFNKLRSRLAGRASFGSQQAFDGSLES